MSVIGIIGAMEEEVEILKSKMEHVEKTEKASMVFCRGLLNGKEVVVVRSGIGKVNAGICTHILADTFQVDYIINTGIAGSLQDKIDIGDIVVSKTALQHDVDAMGFGYPLGEIPRMGKIEYEADTYLAELAKEVCEIVNPDIHVYMGKILSGDQFISDKEVKKKLIHNFSGDCVEMEGAAIAQAAYLNKVPYVVLRAISDKADDSATMDYPEFEKKAIEHCVKLVENMIVRIKE